MDIVMKSEVLEIVKVLKKTSSEMFKNLKVGDRIQMSSKVETVGIGTGGSYAAYIKITNLGTGEYTYKSYNMLPKSLKIFELKEIK